MLGWVEYVRVGGACRGVEHLAVGGACEGRWSMWGVREVERIVGIGGRDEMMCVVGSE